VPNLNDVITTLQCAPKHAWSKNYFLEVNQVMSSAKRIIHRLQY
jgi:hypothetical protein